MQTNLMTFEWNLLNYSIIFYDNFELIHKHLYDSRLKYTFISGCVISLRHCQKVDPGAGNFQKATLLVYLLSVYFYLSFPL